MKKIVLAVAVAGLAAAYPAVAGAASFKGIVVARSAGSLAIASPSGLVQTVRTSAHARVGARVIVSGSHVTVVGRAHRARIRGIVVRRVGRTEFLAAGHSVLAVRTRRGLAAVGDAGPAPGTVVQDEVDIDDQGDLNEQSGQTVGQASTAQIQATVTAVGTGTITLSVNGQSLTLPLPAGLSLPSNIVGTSVTLTLNLGGGTATAQPEQDDNQGDDNDDQGDDNQGSSGGGGGGDD